jgi:spore coat protein U-like protein
MKKLAPCGYLPILKCSLFLGLGLLANQAQAQVSCTANATGVNDIYTRARLRLVGQVSVNCTRTGGATTQNIFIGMDQGEPPTNRDLISQTTPAQTLVYEIFRNNNYTGRWTVTNGVTLAFNFASGNNQSQTAPYYFQIAANITRNPGVYDDTRTLTVRLNNNAGAVLSTSTFTPSANILSLCYFSSAPTALAMNYTSFAAAASTGSSNFGVICTLSTPYSLSLDATTGTLLGLNYTLALSGTGATGTAFQQNFTVNGSIAAGQTGTCASGSGCTASQARTLTIAY